MNTSGENIRAYQEKHFLSHLPTLKEDFEREYKMLYYKKAEGKKLYLQILIEMEKMIREDKINDFKQLNNFISYINTIEGTENLEDYYNDTTNPIRCTNLVILTCKHNNVQLLKYIFDCNEILNNFTICIGKCGIRPSDEDETHHNAFYYAVRSGNIDLLDTLIYKWPNNYFAGHLQELDEILSSSYVRLKIQNVDLSDEMEIFVHNKLINDQFFSDQNQNIRISLDNIKKRIELTLQAIHSLETEDSNVQGVNETFLFVAKFIAQNIHILKRQLKSTYDKLPWEEMEFCLICFISSHTKQQEINLFYNTIINKTNILNHLSNFANRLENEKNRIIKCTNIDKLAVLPKLKREKIMSMIINTCPQFETLYNEYQQISDIHTLEKLNEYIKLTAEADAKTREGQLIIIRTLQIMGEYLKNTLESPKLSSTTSKLLLLSLPGNAREIIINLRNSLSHSYSLVQRLKLEQNLDPDFFINIQNNIIKIGDVVCDILTNNKLKTIRMLLKKIIDDKSLTGIKEVIEINNIAKLNKIEFTDYKMVHRKLQKLIKKLSKCIIDKTDYEKKLFNEINGLMDLELSYLENIKYDYGIGIASLFTFSTNYLMNNNIFHFCSRKDIRDVKLRAQCILDCISPKIKPQSLKEIVFLCQNIFSSVVPRLQCDHREEIQRLIWEIFCIAEFEINDMKWLEILKERLQKDSFIPKHKQRKNFIVTKEKYINHFALKLTELKVILNNYSLDSKSFQKLLLYKNDKKLQTVVEMLVLDLFSILSNSHLENNPFFVDNNAPLLIGKCLRNHLAHDNILLDNLLFDPSIAVIINAKTLTEENIIESKKKIGKVVCDDPYKLNKKYCENLLIINNKEKMFIALEQGNLENFKSCLEEGADIYARNISLWTTLHFAAKGSSLEVIKFILSNGLSINVKDKDGQTPLHIAAIHGRTCIVEFFIKEAGLYVDVLNNMNKTPLYLAVENGHKETVEILIKYKANIASNMYPFSVLQHAVISNHLEIVKTILEKNPTIHIDETNCDYTLLHGAAEYGHFEIVKYLLQNNANVNIGNERNWTSLHAAARNGYLEIVKSLILKGANVNAQVINGCTPLHYAAENNYEEVASILLKYGAAVNAVNKVNKSTPLHFAIQKGYARTVMILLKNKANANIPDINGLTPLDLAIIKSDLEIVNILLKHGVNVNVEDKYKFTPLHYAAQTGYKEVVKILIKNGAHINFKSNCLTPLHLAAINGHEDVCILLIANKAEVNAQDNIGNTPLHTAVTNCNNNVIDILIRNKALVNHKNNYGLTPLHLTAYKGHTKAATVLIMNKADINVKDNNGVTPLHAAVLRSHKEIINLLIKHKADVNARSIENYTPLQLAIETGDNEIVETLIANGANFKSNDKNRTLLLLAIKCNYKQIVKILIANGGNVNEADGKPLYLAVKAGFKDIVEILLKNKASVNIKNVLHLAAGNGNELIVNMLIESGSDVNAMAINNITPLYIAAQEGYENIVNILIARGANVNVKSDDGSTPLHAAAVKGFHYIVNILIRNNATINIKDNENRTAFELAVSYNHLQVVQTFLMHKEVDLNAKGSGNWTVLHIASQEGLLDMIKYLVSKGADINARNVFGSKAIHVAAREGYKDVVEFFLSKGMSINAPATTNQTVLHYAAIKGHLDVLKRFIDLGADVNVTDNQGVTALHAAAVYNFKNVVETLINHGAVYNAVDIINRRPLEMTTDKDIIGLLTSIEKLFKAIKQRNCLDVNKYIKAGANINAKNIDFKTPLHYAAWKDSDDIVKVLLQNKANPNAIDNNGITPLHYAVKFSSLKVIKTLLSNGAIFNAVSNTGVIPVDYATDRDTITLFKTLSKFFQNIENDNPQIINQLNKVKQLDTLKVIMNARNRDNKTLIAVAMHNNFSKIEQLKEISQGDVSYQINKALQLLHQNNFESAMNIFKDVLKKRKDLLGVDNPATLEIQVLIANTLHNQGAYQEALNLFNEIFEKQKELLGVNDKSTLKTKNAIALVLHRQGKNEEAFDIYQELYQTQKKILGLHHEDTLETYIHMALILHALGKYEEALEINKTAFEIKKKLLGPNDPNVIRVQNNIAMVLNSQTKYDEALKIYKDVLEKKKLLMGNNHRDTLRTLQSIANIFFNQKKYNQAAKAYQEVLSIQRNVLGSSHPDTLFTHYSMGTVFFAQHRYIEALKTYKECIHPMMSVFGPNHPDVLDVLKKFEFIELNFKLEGRSTSEISLHLQKPIIIAANNGDIQTVLNLLNAGTDPNDRDIDGRTSLHYAVNNGHTKIIQVLLKNGADVTQLTNKGNTPLHTATCKGRLEVVKALLNHVSHNKLNDFINAKTTSVGLTSLHVAAKSGYFDIMRYLLQRGAIYNIKNNEGKTPVDLSEDLRVSNFLKSLEEFFRDVKNGTVDIINKLKSLSLDDITAVLSARNIEGYTLLQVATVDRNKVIVNGLLEFLNWSNLHKN